MHRPTRLELFRVAAIGCEIGWIDKFTVQNDVTGMSPATEVHANFDVVKAKDPSANLHKPLSPQWYFRFFCTVLPGDSPHSDALNHSSTS
jgi:hypothetical protein